jgi:hypothetical protein
MMSVMIIVTYMMPMMNIMIYMMSVMNIMRNPTMTCSGSHLYKFYRYGIPVIFEYF